MIDLFCEQLLEASFSELFKSLLENMVSQVNNVVFN